MIARKLITLKEPLDFDLQLVATELDTSGKDLVYLHSSLFTDAISYDKFAAFVNDLLTNGVEIESFNDNTVMYEFEEEPIIVHDILGDKYIILDELNARKFETKIDNYDS